MLRRSLYAAILQSRALHVALPALSSVPNSLLRPLGSSNAASFHAPAAAGTAGVADGHAVGASRWAPGSSSAAAAQLAAAAGGTSSCPNKTLLRSFVPFLSSCYNSSSSSSSWLSWLGFAAAGLVAQGSVLAHADAAAGPHDPVWAAALSSAELAVAEAFQEALLDYDRAAAQQQQQQQQQQDTSTAAAPPNTSSSNRPQQPQVELQGHLLSVAIPILPNADVAGLVGLIEEGLDALAAASSSSSSSSSSTSSRLLGTSRVVQWESSRTVRQPPHAAPGSSSSSREELRVQVMVPLQHGSPHEDSSSSSGSSSSSVLGYGRLSVVKPGSPFTGDELALLARLVAAANRPGGPGRGGDSLLRPGWRSGSSSSRHPFSGRSSDPLSASPLARLFGGLVAGLAGDLIGGMAGDAAGDVAGGLAGDVAGDLAGDVAGDLAGDLTGYSADDLVGDLANDIAGAMKSELQRSWKTLLDDLGGGSGSSDNFGSGSSSSSSSGRFSSLEELEEHIEAQLRELAPPELLTWLQQFEQQARQQQQQQHQHQQDFPRSSSSSSSESSRYGGSNGHGPPPPATQQAQAPPQQLQPWQQPAARAAVQQLQQLGAQVYLPSAAALASQQQDGTAAAAAGDDGGGGECGWGSLAGYESQKQALEDYLLLPLKHPEVFEHVASRTRKTAQPGGSRPRAVLFEGPPGTGKTSSARVLSSRVALPLVYVPLEGLTSKWYGESEQNMAKLFKACEALGGCVIFLDELDSLAGSRERPDMHEASRRLLGVLLREIDGFDNISVAGGSSSSSSSSSSSGAGSGGAGGGFGQQQQQQRGAASRRSVLIGATNRWQDLDAALLSRFDLSIHFGLPDEACRAAILQQYAQHLPADALGRIAAQTQGFAGRDLRDVCEQTERQWASRIIRGQVDEAQLPGEADYLAAVQQRRQGAGGGGGSAGRQAPWLDGGQVLQM